MRLDRSLRGALAGGLAAAVWAGQQSLDKRAFRCEFDDVELLGKLVTRSRAWPLAGAALHVQNGAVFGALYAALAPLLPGSPVARGLVAATVEHLGSWPLTRVVDRHHPARCELVSLWGNHRAFAQAAWRHLLFGAVLGELEHRLNRRHDRSLVPTSSNGHGDFERATSATVAGVATGAS